MYKAVRPVRVPGAKPSIQQVWEMLHWGSRLIVTPNDYRTHRLYMRGIRRSDALRYLSGPRAEGLYPVLNPDPEVLEDKIRYERHFGGLGLPVPETLAVIADEARPDGLRTLTTATEVRQFLEAELGDGAGLVVKPVDGLKGAGVTVATGIDGSDLMLSNGDRRPVSELVEETRVGTWIVQKRVVQHPEIEALNSSTLNTLRLGTLRRSDGRVEIIFAVLRVGRAHSQIDAYDHGGYSVRLDPQTGAFADQAYQNAIFSLERSRAHADSGAEFAGRIFPFWGDLLTLAESFARASGPNIFVGWDVAATPDGIVFLEGNHNWGAHLAQIDSRGMLTDELLEALDAEAGITFDVRCPPAVKPLTALRKLRK
ncbi:sugar-transfer associated ATP-grasp domain-containing protein [Parenemella sanctibonifatiensis]|nr:sugar-transfer associated ATP-grasp domain-containing protein [Parenemella sanctibonifatiensis]